MKFEGEFKRSLMYLVSWNIDYEDIVKFRKRDQHQEEADLKLNVITVWKWNVVIYRDLLKEFERLH